MSEFNHYSKSYQPLQQPISNGWFAVACSKDLKPGEEKKGYLANQRYVLFRNLNGNVTFNGRSEGVVEQNDFIFVWFHAKNHDPCWHIPMLDTIGWSPFFHHQLIVRTHPQEVYENCIDLAHFARVHRYSNIIIEQAPCFDGASMWVQYQIQRKNLNLFSMQLLKANFEVRLHGIGCAHTHIHVPSFASRVRMFALTTPTQNGFVEIRLAVAIAMNIRKPFNYMLLPFMGRIIQRTIVRDFCQDILIWENKCYHSLPLVVRGDGPITKFRHWCSQFYK